MSEPEPYPLPQPPLLIVVSGLSGAGKDSLLARLEERGYPFHFVVTATTRPKRSNEVEGREYHFVSEHDFRELMAKNELLEHAVVYGEYKGVPKQQVREALASGKDVILRLDVQGAATIRRLAPEAVLIFLTTDNEPERLERLRTRRTETPDGLKLRLDAAREELRRMDEFDYVVVNRSGALDQAVADVMCIIRAEHCRVHRRQVML